VLFLFLCAALWLVASSLLGLLGAIKLHAPGFLAPYAWLTYGRVQPAAWHGFVYGFASQAGLGAGLWFLVRLGGTPLLGGRGVVLGTIFRNFGVKLGLLALLAGQGTGLEGLEFPRHVGAILLVAYLAMAVWGLVTFRFRRERAVYASQWFVLAAFFGFPWFFAPAHVLGVWRPLRGVLQAAVQAWYVQNLLVLWLGFLALAALFYLLPKLAGRPVASRQLVLFGFWTLAGLGGLAALQRFHGGPFPSWMLSLSVVAAAMLAFPVLALAQSLYGVGHGAGAGKGRDPGLPFARWALFCFVTWGVFTTATSLDFVRRSTQFTLFPVGVDQLFLLGFVGMALLGTIYHAVPRLAGRPWPGAGWIRAHFACAAVAVALSAGAGLVGGLAHGRALDDPALTFVLVQRRYLPFASTATLAQLVYLAGSVLLAINLVRLVAGLGRDYCAPVARGWFVPVDREVEA
jgi:cytochrome c oxidase cbb3-type subunit 1